MFSEYSLAKIGFDTAEDGPLKVCQKSVKSHSKVKINVGPGFLKGLKGKGKDREGHI